MVAGDRARTLTTERREAQPDATVPVMRPTARRLVACALGALLVAGGALALASPWAADRRPGFRTHASNARMSSGNIAITSVWIVVART